MTKQRILSVEDNYSELGEYLRENNIKSIFLVCGKSFKFLNIGKYIDNFAIEQGIHLVKFSDFVSNPTYDSVVKGVELLRKEKADLIMVIGGGSAIDVAKCIKLYYNMDPENNYLEQDIVPNQLPILAVPTTAGTGSESTCFAVIYYKGEKQSIFHKSCLPQVVIFDATVLKYVPEYQRKVTMLDALCHAIESFWSVNSTKASKKFSKRAIKIIYKNKETYLQNKESGNTQMLLAANIAGKAINIAQTTAGHAMSYKLTSMYRISHGHAVALCVAVLWDYMIQHIEDCVDPRGKEYLERVFEELSLTIGVKTMKQGVEKFQELLYELDLEIPQIHNNDYKILKESINFTRLKNTPIFLSDQSIENLYRNIANFNKQL